MPAPGISEVPISRTGLLDRGRTGRVTPFKPGGNAAIPADGEQAEALNSLRDSMLAKERGAFDSMAAIKKSLGRK
jgi:hypothetical protein